MTRRSKPPMPYATVIALIVVAVYYLTGSDTRPLSSAPQSSLTPAGEISDRAVAGSLAFVDGAMVESAGVVERILDDDNDGSRHQRFILRLGDGRTLLIAHNIDLAARIDALEPGDTVRFRGQYETNKRGGVVHWTHHDPRGEHPGGWLEHEGRTYR